MMQWGAFPPSTTILEQSEGQSEWKRCSCLSYAGDHLKTTLVMERYLSLMMKRSDSSCPWGFTVREAAGDFPYLVDQVTEGTLADINLTPGDAILKVEDKDVSLLSLQDLERLIDRPSRCLNLRVLKGTCVVDSSLLDSKFSDVKNSEATNCPEERRPSGNTQDSITMKRHQSDSCITAGGSLTRNHLKKEKENFWEKVCKEGSSEGNEESPAMKNGSDVKTHPKVEEWLESGSFDKDGVDVFEELEIESKPNTERQGDITFWTLDPESEPALSRSGSFGQGQRRPTGVINQSESPLLLKKPSDSNKHGWNHLDVNSPPCSPIPFKNGFKGANITLKSKYHKSVSIVKNSYSSERGSKSLKTSENFNKTTKTETLMKTGTEGKDELFEKTEKNKEYMLSNKDNAEGEKKKIINEYSITEKVVDGEKENCNRIKERLEENLEKRMMSSPIVFYENVDKQGYEVSPEIGRANKCDHSVSRVSKEKLKIPENADSRFSEFKNKNNLFLPRLRKVSDGSQFNQHRRSWSPASSEGQHTSDYWSDDAKSPKTVIHEEIPNKYSNSRSHNIAAQKKSQQFENISKPQPNFEKEGKILKNVIKEEKTNQNLNSKSSFSAKEIYQPLRSVPKSPNFKTTTVYFNFNVPLKKGTSESCEGRSSRTESRLGNGHRFPGKKFTHLSEDTYSSLPASINLPNSLHSPTESVQTNGNARQNTSKPLDNIPQTVGETDENMTGKNDVKAKIKSFENNSRDDQRILSLTLPKPFAVGAKTTAL